MNRPSPISAHGMDLDVRERAREEREQPRRDRHAVLAQRVRHAVREQRLHARPGGEDLERRHAARGGIALVRGRDVAPQLAGDAPQGAARCPSMRNGLLDASATVGAVRRAASRARAGTRPSRGRPGGSRRRSPARRPSAASAPRAPAASRSRPRPGPSTPASAQRGASSGAARERAAVARRAARLDAHHEPGHAEHAALHERHARRAAGGVDGVAGRERVRAVDHEVLALDERGRVLRPRRAPGRARRRRPG